jgi:hypothetical protein
MAEEHRTRVVIEGDATSYTSATAKATRSSDELRGSVDKARKTTESFSTTIKKANDPLVELSKNVTRSSASMIQLGQQAFGVAKAFGGWGVAVAIVGDLLLGLVESSNKATEAAQRQKRALIEQRAAAMDAENADKVESFRRREASIAEGKAKAEDLAARKKIAETAEELVGIENALAQFGRKKDTLALQKRETEIRAENLRIIGDTAGALELERKEELRIIALLGEKEKAARKANAEMAPLFRNAPSLIGKNTGLQRAGSDSREFAAERKRVDAMQRDDSDTRGANDAQYALDARLQSLELERAQTGETISLIDQEEQARARLLQTQINAATIGAEKTDLMHQKQALVHEANLRRLEIEKAAEEKRFARKQQIMSLTEQLSGSVSRTTEIAAKLAGVSAKKQERIAAGTAGAQAIIVGALEQVKAVAAFASLNFVQGAAHQAAAIFAFGQGAMLLAQAGGAGGGGGGGAVAGGGGPMGGGTQAPREATPGAGSDIPGSPGPQAPAAANGNSSGPSRTTVFEIGEVHTYGTPRREWLRELDESLADHRQGSRSRRTGTEG